MSQPQLRQQSVYRADLNARSATVIAQLYGINMIATVWH